MLCGGSPTVRPVHSAPAGTPVTARNVSLPVPFNWSQNGGVGVGRGVGLGVGLGVGVGAEVGVGLGVDIGLEAVDGRAEVDPHAVRSIAKMATPAISEQLLLRFT